MPMMCSHARNKAARAERKTGAGFKFIPKTCSGRFVRVLRLINETRLEAQSQLIADDAPTAVRAHRVGIQEPTGWRCRSISRHEPTDRREGADAAGQELWVVEDVEELRAELDPDGLAQTRALLNGHVPVVDAGRALGIAPKVAGARDAARERGREGRVDDELGRQRINRRVARIWINIACDDP